MNLYSLSAFNASRQTHEAYQKSKTRDDSSRRESRTRRCLTPPSLSLPQLLKSVTWKMRLYFKGKYYCSLSSLVKMPLVTIYNKCMDSVILSVEVKVFSRWSVRIPGNVRFARRIQCPCIKSRTSKQLSLSNLCRKQNPFYTLSLHDK